MTEQEIQILKEVYGLSQIHDLDQLQAAIREKDSQMNALDRLEFQMRIGRKLEEAKAASPNSRYSPSNWSLLVTAVIFAALSTLTLTWVLKTQAWMVFRVVVGIMALVLFIAAWRAVARVIYRLANNKDF